MFVFSLLKFMLRDFALTGKLPSWKVSTDNALLVGLSSIWFFSVYKAWKRSLFTQLQKNCIKLHQLISVGVGTNDGSFFSRDFSAGDKTLQLKLIEFCSGIAVLASSIILLSFSQYIVLRSLLCRFVLIS